MSVSLNGTNGLTFADSTTQNTGGYTGFRNRIINGAMMIDQRNAGASVTGTNYAVDRWQTAYDSGPAVTSQRSTTAPSGFSNSLLLTVTSSASPSGQATFRQFVEGYNVADLGWGTANAQSITVSFWVRSSVTGTYAISLQNAAYNRSYVATYSINSANTWEQKTVTVTGDTTGTWATDNTQGLRLFFDIGCASSYNTTAGTWGAGQYFRTSSCVNLISTSGATFYITGVQLEKGSVATPFEFRPYGTELQLAQRYYYRISGVDASERVFAVGIQNSTTSMLAYLKLAQTMRAVPTVSANELYNSDQTGFTVPSTLASSSMLTDCGRVSATMAANGAQYRPAFIVFKTATGWIDFNSEL